MTKTTKITKRDNYETLLSLLPEMLNANLIDSSMDAQLAEFLNKELENLDKRATNAKKYAAKNKADADALTEQIAAVLALEDRYMTIPEIVDIVDSTDITPQKTTYRLNKLVEAGRVEKETTSIKEEGKTARKINVYRWVKQEKQA